MSIWEENTSAPMTLENSFWEISDSITNIKSSREQLEFERFRFVPRYVYIKINWEKMHLEQVTTNLPLSLKTSRLLQFLHWWKESGLADFSKYIDKARTHLADTFVTQIVA